MELHRRAVMDETYPPLPYGVPKPQSPSPVSVFRKGKGRNLNLLLVEHDPAYASYLQEVLGKGKTPGLKIEWTEWLDAATHRVREGRVDAVLLDIRLPDISGMEIFRAIHQAAPDVPVLILADLDDEAVACRILREGAQDYLPKTMMNPRSLQRSIRFAVERSKAKKNLARKKGRLFDENPHEPQAFETAAPSLDEWQSPVFGLFGSGEPRAEKDGEAAPGERSETPVPALGHTLKILTVEPSDRDYRKLRAYLKGHGEIRTVRVKTIRSALKALSRRAFDLVCVEYLLPDGNGHDFLRYVKELTPYTPVVIITGHRDPVAAAQIIQAGAYDYLPKQKLSLSPLFRVIANALEKARFRKQLEETQRKMVEMSILDDLTGLCNRRHFMETLEKEAGRACRYGSSLVLCMMDVDEFKKVNDTYGHPAGDMVLRELGAMLRKSIRMSDTACRYGGEEFALLLPNTDLREAILQGERLRRMVETHRFEWEGTPFRLTLSLGLASLDRENNRSSTVLLEDADKALYKAKREGKNRVTASEGDRFL